MITLGEWLARGPFGLAMSSGFFAFYAHTGVLGALLESGFEPTSVAGSSAGAMVGGAWAAGTTVAELEATLLGLTRGDFWDPRLGAGLLAGSKFDALLRRLLPVQRLEACRVPVAISVFDILARKTAVLTRGDLALAIRASCAVPAMFHPVWLEAADPSSPDAQRGWRRRRPYWDGGILDRPGLDGALPGRTLYHHIAAHAPWSRASKPHEVPKRPGMVSLVLQDLPRSNPWRLDAGRQALEVARAATLRALDERIVDDAVTLHLAS